MLSCNHFIVYTFKFQRTLRTIDLVILFSNFTIEFAQEISAATRVSPNFFLRTFQLGICLYEVLVKVK
jgi:hypothetical protein